MTVTAEPPGTHPSGLRNALGKRQLSTHPETIPRLGYLGIVVLVTITLHYTSGPVV